MFHIDVGTAQQVDAVGEAVVLAVYDTADASLDDEFGTLDAGRGGYVDGGTVAVVVAAGELRDGIGLSVEDVGLGDVVVVLADILESARRTVIAVADNHAVFYYQRAYLTTLAIGVLGPNASHLQISLVKPELLVLIQFFTFLRFYL